MQDIQKIDSVLQTVQNAAEEFRFPKKALSQQILLLGDSFYGYRFMADDYTAVWSAADNSLKFYDGNGQQIALVHIGEKTETNSVITFPKNPERMAA
ncbi:hypothetical protein FACS189419_02520 [Planctomycetales bacterium]|nr:hypothetical protein FACS189419_02520 [Planctomycetales bacterium]